MKKTKTKSVIMLLSSLFFAFALVATVAYTRASKDMEATEVFANMMTLFRDSFDALSVQGATAQEIVEARASLLTALNYANELISSTDVCETGTSIPTHLRQSHWAPQSAHTAFQNAIDIAQAIYDASGRIQRTADTDVISGSRYMIPILVDDVPLPAHFTFNFNPEIIAFIDIVGDVDVLPLSNPENGVLSFVYHGSTFAHTGLLSLTRFEAVDDGDPEIEITMSLDYEEIYIVSDVLEETPIFVDSDTETGNIEREPFIIIDADGNFVSNRTVVDTHFDFQYWIEMPTETITSAEREEIPQSTPPGERPVLFCPESITIGDLELSSMPNRERDLH
jgi:hypothetical protein